jgi:hypothetical protein
MYYLTGEWTTRRIGDKAIDVQSLIEDINRRNVQPITLSLWNVACRDLDVDTNSNRYKLASTSYPLIVVHRLPNPLNRPYTLIDGRHRMHKLLTQGKTDAKVYALEKTDIEEYIIDIPFFNRRDALGGVMR